MTLLDINGNKINCCPSKYLINWDRAVSKPQKIIKDVLKPYWQNQFVCEEFRIPKTKLRLDLINFTLKIAVEISPSSSHGYNKFFHKNRSSYVLAKKRDLLKYKWIEVNEFLYIEVCDDTLKNPESILELIY